MDSRALINKKVHCEQLPKNIKLSDAILFISYKEIFLHSTKVIMVGECMGKEAF